MRYSDAGLMTCTSKDPETDELDYEVELCVVIGKTVPRRTTKEDAMEYVLGYTVAHDVSARDWQVSLLCSSWLRRRIRISAV